MTLRAIDITGQAPVPSIDPGPLPRVIMVNLDELVVDETYQRPLGRANWMMIRRIAERFQWSRFQPIMVAQVPDGRYAVIDGQHRAHAAALAGHVAVPASLVTTALSAITGSTQAENVDFYRETVLRALFVVLRDHPDFLYLDLARVIDLINLDDWERDTTQLRARPEWSGKSLSRCRAQVLRMYLSQAAVRGTPPKPEPKPAPAKPRSVAVPPKRFAAAPCATDDPAPRNPSWPEDRDAAVIASGGKYAKITELAEKWDIPISTVQARWHRLRAA